MVVQQMLQKAINFLLRFHHKYKFKRKDIVITLEDPVTHMMHPTVGIPVSLISNLLNNKDVEKKNKRKSKTNKHENFSQRRTNSQHESSANNSKSSTLCIFRKILLMFLFLSYMTPVTPQYFNEKSSLVFYFSLHLTYCQSMNEIPDLVEKTTSVSLGKYVLLIENDLITQVKLPLVELTSVLDDLKFKLENL
jgi:hypothetical protein